MKRNKSNFLADNHIKKRNDENFVSVTFVNCVIENIKKYVE